jgi:hypothetical protein
LIPLLEILSRAISLERGKRNYQHLATQISEGFELLFKNEQNSVGNKYGKTCIFAGATPYFCGGWGVWGFRWVKILLHEVLR